MTGLRVAGTARTEFADVGAEQWVSEARALYKDGWWFEGLWGQKVPSPEVLALWGRRGELKMLRLECPDGTFPSLTSLVPAGDWFERALRDRTGLVPRGHVDPRPFLFHETYAPGYVHGDPVDPLPLRIRSDYAFLRHEGPGVFEIPVGPIHAGIIEPGHFRFTTAGELILDLEIRLNFTHKGTLSLAQGRPVEHAIRLLERLSGDNAAAHACAFAAAVEAGTESEAPAEVEDLRSVMVELERLYNHVGDLGGIATDVALPAVASHFQALKEELMRWNGRLFGHRLLMNAVAFGGLHRAPSADAWTAFARELPQLRSRFERAAAMAVNHSGLKERVEGTGFLNRSTAELLACVGPVARASGIARDVRHDAPCLAYPRRPLPLVMQDRGTVSSRMWVRVDEARATLTWLDQVVAEITPDVPGGRACSETGEGLALVEASRGGVLSWARIRDGLVENVYQRDPSFLNWRGLDDAIWRNIVPDFPINNKSFGLSYSGSDA